MWRSKNTRLKVEIMCGASLFVADYSEALRFSLLIIMSIACLPFMALTTVTWGSIDYISSPITNKLYGESSTTKTLIEWGSGAFCSSSIMLELH